MIAIDSLQHQIDQKKQLERYERAQLERELNQWGRWIEGHYDYKGYPSIDIIERARIGSGGGSQGHKILCLDMPAGIYATHARVLRLPEAEQDAILIRYCVKIKDDGTFWTITDLCIRAGIKLQSFNQRLWRARQRIMGLPIAIM